MTPAARLQMAIEILEALEATAQPTDRFLKAWFRMRRFAGSGDRRAIGERVFAVQRHHAHLAHRMGSDTPRALVIAALLEAGDAIEPLFTGGYGPAPLTDAERAAIAAPPAPAPRLGAGRISAMAGSRTPARFRRTAAGGDAGLHRPRPDRPAGQHPESRTRRGAGMNCRRKASRAAPRLTPRMASASAAKPASCRRSALFQSGAFEIQDEAAQIASALCAATPGMRVLDLAAGAGGKSLALAAAMENQGEIIACDVRGEALVELEKRAGRAGVTIIKTLHLEHAQPTGPFDLVLLDAPCSGTGTWRRQPELRWRLTPARLAELTALQDRLLDQAAAWCGPAGGWSMPPAPSCPWKTRTGWRPSWPAIPALPRWT